MDQAKPCSSPMASTCSLTVSDGEPCADANLYRIMVGRLLISKAANLDLQAFSDSDWAADRDDRRSVGAH
ncbi:hypothetical protein F0562_006160 [Nyssa sinensis]|uniref:Uncharacterized protein n=1 Tax=Nyssa sinensis TaxID=561372 RepID=A0A5J5AQ00_9ASTE|nr:hypothetical protein F0562_006160 [Nyssa sinensis]